MYPARKRKCTKITRCNTAVTELCHCWMIQSHITLQMCAKPFFFNWLFFFFFFAVCLGFIFCSTMFVFVLTVPLFLLMDTQYEKLLLCGVLLWCKLCSSAWLLIHWGVKIVGVIKATWVYWSSRNWAQALISCVCVFGVLFKSFNRMWLALLRTNVAAVWFLRLLVHACILYQKQGFLMQAVFLMHLSMSPSLRSCPFRQDTWCSGQFRIKCHHITFQFTGKWTVLKVTVFPYCSLLT